MRLAWWISIALSMCAYIGVITPAHRAIAGFESKARSLYDSANRDERLIEHAREIRDDERRAERMIAQVGGNGGTDALLEMLDRESAKCHVLISGVTPTADEAGTAQLDPLRSTLLTIDLEGRFSGILALLNRLGEAAPLVSVDTIALTPARTVASGSPILHATLGIQLYALMADRQKGRPDESSRAPR